MNCLSSGCRNTIASPLMKQTCGANRMDLCKDNISTLSATDSNPGYFCQLMLSGKYVPGNENAFADFLSWKYDIGQPGNNKPSTSNQDTTTDMVNVVETRAKSRQKLAPPPQDDSEAPPAPEEKIVDPVNLPKQDLWPFT
uniref:Uncharacterized protein n=1 Tax=Romanomermis culicivorax TaxID=13658 RepID=A0A915K0H2_ROMCU